MISRNGWSTMKKLFFEECVGTGSCAEWKTETGNPLTFSTSAARPLRRFDLAFLPKQDLNGQTAPYPPGGGKNKFDPDTTGKLWVNLDKTISTRSAGKSMKLPAQVGESWTASMDNVRTGTNLLLVVFLDSNDTVLERNIVGDNKKTVSGTAPANTAYVLCCVYTYAEAGNVQLELNSSATDFAPYSNICPIVPWGKVTAWHTGGNLLDDSKRYVNSAMTSVYFGTTVVTSTDYPVHLKAGKYTVSVNFDESYGMYYKEENSAQVALWTSGHNINQATFTIGADGNYRFYAYRGSGAGGVDPEKVHEVMLNCGETALPYSPYAGQSYPVNLRKNLFDKANDVLGGYITSGGIFKASSSGEKTISVYVKAGTYTLSKISTTRLLIAYFADTPVNNAEGTILSSVQTSPRTVTVSEDGYIVAFVYNNSGETNTWENVLNSIQLEEGSTATPYQPYIPPVYGGYVDLLTGEVWANYWMVEFDGSEDEGWSKYGTPTASWYRQSWRSTGLQKQIKERQTILEGCVGNGAIPLSQNSETSAASKDVITCRSTSYKSNYFYIFTPLSLEMTLDDLESMLAENPVQFAYPLETPVLLATLTAKQINALVGVNTIWSDTNGANTVVYLKKP